MRPISITMQAFGPYLGSEVVNFEELGERRMFLISGDTGAGKSTILDAMCFALYGESPGEERTAAEMRSKNASPKLSTTIEFTFTVGTKRYTVKRSPMQTRPKQRGDGETTINAKAELVRLDESGEVAIAAQPKKVSEEIITLLGFTAVQFRQVVVLPQGQFRKFLSSNSDERQKILSDLFRTLRYERVETALRDRAKKVTEQLGEVNAKVDGLLAGVQVDSTTNLESQIELVESDLKQGEVELHTSKTLLTGAIETLNQAKKLFDLFTQRDRLISRTKEIEATSDEQVDREQRLTNAERAISVSADFERTTQLTKQQASLDTQLAEAKTREAKFQNDLLVATEKLELAKHSEPRITETASAIDRLQELKISVADLASTTKQFNIANAAASEATQAVNTATKSLKNHELEREKLRKELSDLNANNETPELVEQEGKTIKIVIDNHQRYAKLLSQQQQIESELNTVRKSQEAFAVEIEKAREKLQHLEQARDQGRATLLAQTLVTNTPCPVCGSTDHPQPSDSKIDIPGENDIDLARNNIDSWQNKSAEGNQTLGELSGKNDSVLSEISSLKTTLGAHVDSPLARLEDTRSQLAQRYREAKSRVARKEEAESCLKILDDQVSNETQSVAALSVKATDLAGAMATASGARESILTRVPEQYRDPGAIDAEIESSKRQHDELKSAAALATEQHQAAAKAHAEVVSEIKTQSNSQKELTSSLESASKLWTEKRSAAGFNTDDAWIEARLEEEALNELRRGVEQYRTELDQAQGALKEAEKACAGQTIPNIVGFEQKHTEAHARWDTLNTDVTNKRVRLEQLKSTRSQINQTFAGQETLDAEYKVVQHLANIATGGPGNQLKLSLHRYVLGVILDEVLVAATHRLLHLSRGRYRLERRLGAGDQRRAGGLELDVFDGDTGESRPVATLSGGEGFQAALALALGLAEVTQNHAGGIHLETLFVDEGFGSLDQEALQAAITTLIEANRDGRLIGIISHVAELKEHIDTRLDINKSVYGSSTQWIIP